MFYVYILKSLRDRDIYVGTTRDLKKRLAQHNNGLNQSTAYRRPFVLAYYEAYGSEEDAKEREKKLKQHAQALAELKKRIGRSLA